MTALAARQVTEPSPSRSNPFARSQSVSSILAGEAGSGTSFSRTSILPTLASPLKTVSSATVGDAAITRRINPFATPSAAAKTTEGPLPNTAPGSARGSASKGRTGCRLLWRGGLEIGDEGYRLDGEMMFRSGIN